MQNLTIAEQNHAELPLFGLEWGFGANGDFSFVLSDFSLVAVTSILAITIRVGATIILEITEEAVATITEKFFFKGLTNRN